MIQVLYNILQKLKEAADCLDGDRFSCNAVLDCEGPDCNCNISTGCHKPGKEITFYDKFVVKKKIYIIENSNSICK